jgi:Transcriptional regulators
MATLPPRRDEIVDKLADQIRSGERSPHTKLPSTTELAEEYGVSVGTAYRAYQKLHEMGLIYGRPGLGRFVAEIER